MKKDERDCGVPAGMPSDVAENLKAPERENRELWQANEILRCTVERLNRVLPHRLLGCVPKIVSINH